MTIDGKQEGTSADKKARLQQFPNLTFVRRSKIKNNLVQTARLNKLQFTNATHNSLAAKSKLANQKPQKWIRYLHQLKQTPHLLGPMCHALWLYCDYITTTLLRFQPDFTLGENLISTTFHA